MYRLNSLLDQVAATTATSISSSDARNGHLVVVIVDVARDVGRRMPVEMPGRAVLLVTGWLRHLSTYFGAVRPSACSLGMQRTGEVNW